MEALDGLKFKDDLSLNDHVSTKTFVDPHAAELDGDWGLAFHEESTGLKHPRKDCLINRFQKPGPKSAVQFDCTFKDDTTDLILSPLRASVPL